MFRFKNKNPGASKGKSTAHFRQKGFDIASVALMSVDRDLIVTDVNEATRELFRTHEEAFRNYWPTFDPEDIIGSCIDMFHKNPAHQRKLLSDPQNLPFETDITIDDLKISLIASAVYDELGNYVGNILEWADVTELRTKTGTLAALDKAQAIIEFSLDGFIQHANENFLNTVGYRLEDIVGKHHRLFMCPEAAASSEYRSFWSRLKSGEYVDGKFSRVKNGGEEIWLRAIYSPILDSNGVPFKVVKFATDITETHLASEHAKIEQKQYADNQSMMIKNLASGLHALASGDLEFRINTEFSSEYDQLRIDFNSALDSLERAMGAILSNASIIQNGVNEISQASDDLSRRTESQAATLEQTAAALDQVTSGVKQTAQGANDANQSASGARSDAQASGDVVRKAVGAMSEIEKSSAQISQIIGVIDEIAFQTNLLALNAGVEAARAGDAGRGFAVVASEVRALAQRSSEAAKEIKSLISASSQHVETGVDLVGRAGTALEQIVTRVTEVSDLVSNIALSAEDQARGLAEVNTAMTQLDGVTQQNVAMVEEATAASHSLSKESRELVRLVSRFKSNQDVAELSVRPEETGAPALAHSVNAQQSRVAQFAASTLGNTALDLTEDDDWSEF